MLTITREEIDAEFDFTYLDDETGTIRTVKIKNYTVIKQLIKYEVKAEKARIIAKIEEYRRTRLYDEVLKAIDDILIKIEEEKSGYDQMIERDRMIGEQIHEWTNKAWTDHNGI